MTVLACRTITSNSIFRRPAGSAARDNVETEESEVSDTDSSHSYDVFCELVSSEGSESEPMGLKKMQMV